jgi:hypothetical protein
MPMCRHHSTELVQPGIPFADLGVADELLTTFVGRLSRLELAVPSSGNPNRGTVRAPSWPDARKGNNPRGLPDPTGLENRQIAGSLCRVRDAQPPITSPSDPTRLLLRRGWSRRRLGASRR